MTRFGGDCYGYCLLAAGFVDLIVEAGLKPYDVVALIPIIEGAGGRITTWEGKPATDGGRIVAAGDPARARGGAGRPAQCRLSRPARRRRCRHRRPPRSAAGLSSVSCRISWRACGISTCVPTLRRSANSSIACVETMLSMPAANISSGTSHAAADSRAIVSRAMER